MKFLYSDEPIIACSTCLHANAAISVLRISGFQEISSFSAFFELELGPIEPRRVYFTKLLHRGTPVDDICLTYFQGPKSYNGENILELSIHGNTLNVERIMNLFISEAGCRAAAPGEFTYRALKNKKLTLSQVEGLDLFLNANSGYALDQGLSLLSGSLYELYQDLYDLFLIHKSSLELSIDFSEDIGEESAREYFKKSLRDFSEKFNSLYKRVLPMDQNLLNPEIVIAGLPNSGKSSLFNLLLSDERAIVSPIAGTTRDYLSESIVIEGVKYRLIDTAGVRDSRDEVETEGIRRTWSKVKHSFFSLLLINPFEVTDSLKDLVNLDFDLILFTHSDLPGFDLAREKLVLIYPQLGPMGAVSITKKYLNTERIVLVNVNKKYLKAINSKPILFERHKSLILHMKTVLDNYTTVTSSESDVAVLSFELNTLGHCVSELVGIVSPDQVLDSIFSNFCIGK